MSKGGGTPTIPTDYTYTFGGNGSTIHVDSDLDNIHVKELPRFEIAVTQFPETTANANIAVKEIPLIKTSSAITEIAPITSNVNFALTEIPEQRVHLPTHYQLCFSLFGVELWSVSLCGESQVINEKYVPRRTEVCG